MNVPAKKNSLDVKEKPTLSLFGENNSETKAATYSND